MFVSTIENFKQKNNEECLRTAYRSALIRIASKKIPTYRPLEGNAFGLIINVIETSLAFKRVVGNGNRVKHFECVNEKNFLLHLKNKNN